VPLSEPAKVGVPSSLEQTVRVNDLLLLKQQSRLRNLEEVETGSLEFELFLQSPDLIA
jgi:hypothetical protein